MNRLPEVKAFLRRPGGVDQYPAVEVQWQLHRSPQLYALDDSGNVVNNKPIDLSHLKYDELHALFSSHFERKHVPPPHFMVRQWRRLSLGLRNIDDGVDAPLRLRRHPPRRLLLRDLLPLHRHVRLHPRLVTPGRAICSVAQPVPREARPDRSDEWNVRDEH